MSPGEKPDAVRTGISIHVASNDDVSRQFRHNVLESACDRGRLQPGLKADVNVIDFEGLHLHSPKMIFDLPAGGRRLVQSVDGYDMTICSGMPIFEKGQDTGARPGKLVRSS